MSSRCLFALVALVGFAGCSDDSGPNNTNNNSNDLALCGDGETTGAEQCDDGPANSDSLPDACRTDCRVAHCGDGVTDAGEECDDGPQNSDEVPDACRSDCRAPRCGDGVTDLGEGEGCDCGDGSGELPRRCAGPNSEEEGATCRTSCVPAGCGDGLLEGDELCDGALLGGGTCQQYGYYQGELSCTGACSYDLSGCSERCGDGVKNGDEVCDTTPPVGESCLDYGFDLGRLGCSDYCTPGFQGCGDIGWKRVPPPSAVQLQAVWFDPAGVAYLVGHDVAGGYVGRFDGATWTRMTLPAGTPRLTAVWGTSASDLFVVGEGGTVLHFDGTAWTTEILSGYFYGVWGSSSSDVWVVGQDVNSPWVGRLWHFDGSTWTPGIGTAITFSLRGVWGSGPNDVYAVGEQGNHLHYNGTSWTHSTAIAGSLRSVWGTGPSDVFVAGSNGMYHFDGSQWRAMLTPAAGTGLTGVWGTASDSVFAVGNGTYGGGVLLHYDGAFWREFETGYIGVHKAIAGSSSSFVLAVGDASLAHRFSGVGWTHLDLSALDQEYPNAIWGTSPAEVFVAGQGNEPLYRFTPTGWEALCPGYRACFSFHSIWGSSPQDVFFVGGEQSNCSSDAVRYTAGGCTAQTVADGFANVVTGSGPSDAWVGSSDGTYAMARYTTAWAPVPGVTGDVYAAWASADGQVFAVGNDDTIWHYAGGNWTVDTVGSDGGFDSVWGSGPDDVYAVGGPNNLVHWDGASWTPVPLPSSESLTVVWGRSATDIYLAGAWGTVLHYDGTAWSPVRTTHSDPIRYIWGIDRVVYFVRGGERAIDGLLDLR